MPTLVDDPEIATIAIATLTKMVSLLAAELVVGTHHDDIDLIEACVRKKLYASVEGIASEPTAAGVALAHQLIEPVLRDLRARVRAQRALATPPVEPEKTPGANRRLN